MTDLKNIMGNPVTFYGIYVSHKCTDAWTHQLTFDNKHYHNMPIHFTSSAEQELFDSITRFLVQHNGRVSRKELETHFHYSGDYLYKITQKFTGLSLFDYGMKFCMQKACDYSSQPLCRLQIFASSLVSVIKPISSRNSRNTMGWVRQSTGSWTDCKINSQKYTSPVQLPLHPIDDTEK